MNRKKIIVLGAGGFGKEIVWLAHDCGYEVHGFLDEDPDKKIVYDKPVLGITADWKKWSDFLFIIGVGSSTLREKIYKDMTKDEIQPEFATLIHPSVVMSETVQVGSGSMICAGTILTSDIIIKNHVVINIGSTVGHDCVIEDYVTISPRVSVSGKVRLEKGVEIGTGAAIRENLSIASGAMLGMGSVLTKDIKKCELFFGIPAKRIKSLFRE